MHTTKIKDIEGALTDSRATVINHNGDYSGDVLIRRLGVDGNPGPEVAVPFDHLKQFVADYIRSERMQRLADQETDSLLGM